MNVFAVDLIVFIVVSTDMNSISTIVQTTLVEPVANDLVTALDDADSGANYTYTIVKKPIVR